MAIDFPLRCPHCQALVVDRRSAACTTCRQPLPAEWVMTAGQRALTEKIDRQSKAQHAEEMRNLTPAAYNPDLPPLVRLFGNVGPPF